MRVRLLFLGLLFLTSIVQAGPITFACTGTVSQDPLLDPSDPFGGTIASGTSFPGTFTFESTTPDADPIANTGSILRLPAIWR